MVGRVDNSSRLDDGNADKQSLRFEIYRFKLNVLENFKENFRLTARPVTVLQRYHKHDSQLIGDYQTERTCHAVARRFITKLSVIKCFDASQNLNLKLVRPIH